jgi:uncharacterized protein (TIGR03083 family)
MEAESLKPILVAHLLREIDSKLIELLRSLTPDDWEKPTIAGTWKVKDVAAHLLDTHLRKLSICRDGYIAEIPRITSHEDLIAYINGLNQQGVALYRRLSADVLISLMEVAAGASADFHESLDPFAEARFAVSWAGDSKSPNWFDTARELTERWHHQEQIRIAVNKPGIMTPELYHPVLDCFMRALPFTYQMIPSDPGTMAQFNVSGGCGGRWFLHRNGGNWRLLSSPQGRNVSETVIPQEIAWRIFTKGINSETARAQVAVTGDQQIGLHILNMISIVG